MEVSNVFGHCILSRAFKHSVLIMGKPYYICKFAPSRAETYLFDRYIFT